MKKRIILRNLIPIAAICLVTGFFIALLGFLNYKNNMLNIQTNQGKQFINYVCKFIDSFELSLEAKDSYKIIDAVKDTSSTLKIEEANYFFYDKEDEIMYGTDSESCDHTDAAMVESGFKEIIIDNIHYIPVDVNDRMYIIAAYDTTSLSIMLNTVIPQYAKWFGISFCLLCLILLLIGLISKKKRAGKKGACFLVAIWMIILSTYLAVYTGAYFFGHLSNNRYCILDDIKKDVENANEYTAEEMVFQLAMIDILVNDSHLDFNYTEVFDDEGNLTVTEEDLKKQFLILNVSYYKDFSNFFSKIQLKDNILDESVDIEKRVDFTINWKYISNCFIAYILQIFMLGSCAIVLILEIFYYEEERMQRYMEKSPHNHNAKIHITTEKPHLTRVAIGKVRQFSSRYSIPDRIKLILTIQQCAEALLSAVSVVMLRTMVMNQYTVYGGIFITIIIAGEGIISACAIFLFPKISRICKTNIGFIRFASLACIIGTGLCFLSKSCWIYVAGFVIICLGSALGKLILFVNITGEDDKNRIYKNISNYAMGKSVGALMGFVISSVISTLINDRAIFIFGFVLFLIMLILTIGEKEDRLPLVEIKISKIFKTLKAMDLWVYMILIIFPLGMVDYFIKYKIPLDISAIGLTTALVSFLYYLRCIIRMLCKYKKFHKPFRKINSHALAIIMPIANAAIITLYCLFPNFTFMIIAIIIMSYIQSVFGISTHGNNVSIEASNIEENSCFYMMQKGAKKLGNTLSSFLTNAFGITSLAFTMAGAALAYLGYYLIRRKK